MLKVDWTWEEKKVSMREAIHNMTFATLKASGVRMFHPIAGPLDLLFGIKVEMGNFFKSIFFVGLS